MKKIDPSKRSPQAPRHLRVGSKGFARAVAARAEGKDAPEPKPDDDEDEYEEDDAEARADARADAMASHEDVRAEAEAAHMAAADAYKASKGTDSAAALMAAEDAGDAAYATHCTAKASSMKLRGADAPDSSRAAPPAPAPSPGAAQALATLAGPAVASQMALSQWAGAAQELAGKLGARNVGQFQALGLEAVEALTELPKVRAKLHKLELRGVLEGAVFAGMPREKAFHVTKDGSVGDPLAVWSRMTIEDVRATCVTMGYAPGAQVSARNTLIISAPPGNLLDDEAGLADRARASGMTLDERRAAEANQRRSAELERSRNPQEMRQ